MTFEIYKGRKEKQEKQAVVSLSKNSLTLNKIARETLHNPESLELAYDRNANLIRIKSAENGEGQTMKKTKVYSKNFFKHFNIDKKGKFNALFISDDNALYVNLNQ